MRFIFTYIAEVTCSFVSFERRNKHRTLPRISACARMKNFYRQISSQRRVSLMPVNLGNFDAALQMFETWRRRTLWFLHLGQVPGQGRCFIDHDSLSSLSWNCIWRFLFGLSYLESLPHCPRTASRIFVARLFIWYKFPSKEASFHNAK
jgi:hypothetical protein